MYSGYSITKAKIHSSLICFFFTSLTLDSLYCLLLNIFVHLSFIRGCLIFLSKPLEVVPLWCYTGLQALQILKCGCRDLQVLSKPVKFSDTKLQPSTQILELTKTGLGAWWLRVVLVATNTTGMVATNWTYILMLMRFLYFYPHRNQDVKNVETFSLNVRWFSKCFASNPSEKYLDKVIQYKICSFYTLMKIIDCPK